jgi:hypothetical protein
VGILIDDKRQKPLALNNVNSPKSQYPSDNRMSSQHLNQNNLRKPTKGRKIINILVMMPKKMGDIWGLIYRKQAFWRGKAEMDLPNFA